MKGLYAPDASDMPESPRITLIVKTFSVEKVVWAITLFVIFFMLEEIIFLDREL